MTSQITNEAWFNFLTWFTSAGLAAAVGALIYAAGFQLLRPVEPRPIDPLLPAGIEGGMNHPDNEGNTPTMNDETYLTPLPPIADEVYAEAHTSFRDGDDDLDGICIAVHIMEVIRRGLCDLVGDAFYDEPTMSDGEPFDAESERAFEALVHAGILRRDDFHYADGRVSHLSQLL